MLMSKNCVSLVKHHKWIRPEGHDTGIKVFNCITKNKEPLIVKNKNFVTWYTCGPTVYDSSHIGHASCFMKLDIIQRILKQYFNLNLVTVMNITDVDDKIINRSNASKVPVQELTQRYEKEFWKDIEELDISKPDVILRVTENIEIIKNCIEKLMKCKKAYQAENGTIYFDVGAYSNYGKLQNISSENPEHEHEYKKSSMDFALWKSAKSGEVYWESPWGNGRPGWHIECSALASHIFGPEIDIHAGGIDLRFPHHENEEAQSCALHCKTQWVNYWIHTGHLHLKDSEKMSKSLKNTMSVSSLLANTTPQTFRMACLMSHYRKHMEFSPEFMATASTNLQNYINFIDTCKNYLNGLITVDVDNNAMEQLVQDSAEIIYGALTDDFNTPLVVKTLNKLVSAVNITLHSSKTHSSVSKSVNVVVILNLVLRTLNMLGLDLSYKKHSESGSDFVEIMNILNDFRQNVRQLGISKKDQQLLEMCDTVRHNLKNSGIILKDHGKVSSWST
ncbi:hypothetical protein Zmor_001763 [Zophobas morio]|uniref:Cysteine--tRNA ligase n=1 Tax=Zophobas morio TaxID=2755281 RepID=A0AA38IZK9_9CUCU|nr:hypothetical protein Zmor_001763 [Zophobas morio]